jgi:hypothetical protein
MRACVTDDFSSSVYVGSELAVANSSPAEMVAIAEAFWAQQTDRRRHFVSGTFFQESSPDEATAISYLALLITEEGAKAARVSSGYYWDHFIRDQTGWLIQRRETHLDSQY